MKEEVDNQFEEFKTQVLEFMEETKEKQDKSDTDFKMQAGHNQQVDTDIAKLIRDTKTLEEDMKAGLSERFRMIQLNEKRSIATFKQIYDNMDLKKILKRGEIDARLSKSSKANLKKKSKNQDSDASEKEIDNPYCNFQEEFQGFSNFAEFQLHLIQEPIALLVEQKQEIHKTMEDQSQMIENSIESTKKLIDEEIVSKQFALEARDDDLRKNIDELLEKIKVNKYDQDLLDDEVQEKNRSTNEEISSLRDNIEVKIEMHQKEISSMNATM